MVMAATLEAASKLALSPDRSASAFQAERARDWDA